MESQRLHVLCSGGWRGEERTSSSVSVMITDVFQFLFTIKLQNATYNDSENLQCIFFPKRNTQLICKNTHIFFQNDAESEDDSKKINLQIGII